MKKIVIINGPNLNLVGKREPSIYGTQSLNDYLTRLASSVADVNVETFQTNHEGAIIDLLQECGYDDSISGIVLNAGAYTHTSLAVADAIAAIEVPVVEVHISNVAAREEVRRHSFIAPVCRGSIVGFGLDVYRLAIEAIKNFE